MMEFHQFHHVHQSVFQLKCPKIHKGFIAAIPIALISSYHFHYNPVNASVVHVWQQIPMLPKCPQKSQIQEIKKENRGVGKIEK